MKKLFGPFLFMGLLVGFATNAMALSVTPTDNGTILANTILGSGVTIVGPVTYNGLPVQSGTFSGGLASGLGIESGIIMTSGEAALAVGPNTGGANVGLGAPGDATLTGIIGSATNDAAVLEFDFTTTQNNLFFNYVFASTEYNGFVNSPFNDVFAFLLDGVNIALVPGTTQPVAINTVNGGNPFGTNATHPEFYKNNDPNDPGPSTFDLNYNGFTSVFTAQALGLTAGTHHIKLAIADTADTILDSAVFIQAQTFSDVPVPPVPPVPGAIPEPSTWLLLGSGFAALAALRRKASRNSPQ